MSIPLKQRASVLAFIGINTVTYFAGDYAGAGLDAVDRLVNKTSRRASRFLSGTAFWCYQAHLKAERNLYEVERMSGR